ncbi:MAG: hypothetical protein RJA83_1002 [Pseudomonadota bacterium]|jgi:SAM-dependent methyltransferase
MNIVAKQSIYKKIIYTIILPLALCHSSFASLSKDEWKDYIDGTVGKSNYYLYKETRNKFFNSSEKHRALDLGSGAGNEDVDLLTRGWDVVGVDASPRSGEIIKERAKGLNGHFSFLEADFRSAQLTGYYDFVMSFYSLPFGNKKELSLLVKNIGKHMKNGGIFAVTFFGYQHDFVKQGKAYGISKEELNNILRSNQFNVTFFLNRIFDQKTFAGDPVHWDVFDVVAVKSAAES